MTDTTIKLLPVGEVFPINEDITSLVPQASPEDSVLISTDIRENGLLIPVLVYKGELVDGRARQLACTLANIPIKYEELSYKLTTEQVVSIVNSNHIRRGSH